MPPIILPREIRILGAGRFGRIAAERLKRRFPDAGLLITDEDSSKIEKVRLELGVSGEVEDSIRSITKAPIAGDLWLVPAVPVHVGFEWLLHELGGTASVRRLAVPASADTRVPNPIRSPSGTLYASFATFICPDTCNEPAEICTRTGQGRQGNLYELLDALRLEEFETTVLRSWQLAPGVGGYPVQSLTEMLSAIMEKPGKHLVATSCRCHGVIDALEWGKG